MSYDPVTKSGGFNYGRNLAEETNERLAELEKARDQLRITTDLNLETKDGLTTYRARFAPRQPGTKRTVASVSVGAPAPAEGVGQWFPVIIPPGAPPGDRPGELAQFLWDGMGDSSVAMILAAMANQAESVPRSDPQIAFLLLHETTEMGIVDHYYRGHDRRWFCDGVANYGAWRVLCDLRGEPIATQAHDLGRQLREFADLGSRADLRKWPAVEDESGGAQAQSRLNLARYTFAERAVALMVERGGPDILPRLFAEIGRTKPEKVSIRTVEQAWKKLTGTRLEVLLAEAVKPLPPAARSADMGPAKGK